MVVRQLRDVVKHLRRYSILRNDGTLTDDELLGLFASKHDEDAFKALVTRHGPLVLGVCRRVLGHVHDAEDAFQVTFIVLARKAATLRKPKLVGNWLYGTAYRIALKAKSLRARRCAREIQVSELPQVATVDERSCCGDLGPLLDEELSRLPKKYRAPLVLCHLKDRSRKEAAAQLQIPEGTLSSRLATARAMLAKRLGHRGVTISGGVLAMVLTKETASACLPPSLISATTKAAMLCAAGQMAAAGLSPHAVALAEGMVSTLSAGTVLKLGLSLAFALSITVAGATYLWKTVPARAEVAHDGQADTANNGKDRHQGQIDQPEGPQAVVGDGCRITSPMKSQRVPQPFEASGWLGKDAPGHVWLAVKLGEAPNELYWPKHNLTKFKGQRWTKTVDESSRKFTLVLLAVSPDGDGVIRTWIGKRVHFPGLRKADLFGAEELDIVDGLEIESEP